MKEYLLKEYGSWIVFFFSFLTGLTVSSGPSGLEQVTILIAGLILVNSKQSLTRLLRRERPKRFLISFILQVLAASILIFITLGSSVLSMAVYALIPILYFILLFTKGEHFFLTEITGFATLSLAGLAADFTATGAVHPQIYLSIAIFFTASVFKIRVQIRKRVIDRALTFLYTGAALLVFQLLELPYIVLLPLLENLIHSITLYSIRLRYQGWIEALKTLIFFSLMTLYY